MRSQSCLTKPRPRFTRCSEQPVTAGAVPAPCAILRDYDWFCTRMLEVAAVCGIVHRDEKNKTTPRQACAGAHLFRPALEKGIEIVELLAEEPAGLTIVEIAARLRRSMNEVFRIIVVMGRHGWLDKNPDTDRYSVTYHLLEMAMRATPTRSLTAVAGPIMSALATQTAQSCHLVVRAGGRGLIIQREENASLQGGFALRPGAQCRPGAQLFWACAARLRAYPPARHDCSSIASAPELATCQAGSARSAGAPAGFRDAGERAHRRSD